MKPRASVDWRRALVRRLTWLTGLSLAGLSLPAWHAWLPGATLRWLGDLAVHWQWPYLLLGMLAGLAWLALTRRRAAAASLAAVALGGALSLWVWPLDALPRADAAPQGIKLVSFNVHLDNTDMAAMLDWLDAQQADVVALLEVTPDMAPLLQGLAARYPHGAQRPRPDPFGMALFSRFALAEARFHGDGAAQHWSANVMAPGGAFGLRVIHPMPPISAADQAARDEVFNTIAAQPAPHQGQVLLGDFNSTPWSAGLRRLGNAGWARATGLAPTWSLGRSLPLDHILATRGHWRVSAAGTGPWLGSDHRPVWAVLQPLAHTIP